MRLSGHLFYRAPAVLMTDELKLAIQQAHETLRDLYRQAEEAEGFLLDCDIDTQEELAAIEGNVAGLLYLASKAVGLSLNETRGAHAHFDAWDENDELAPDRLVIYKAVPADPAR